MFRLTNTSASKLRFVLRALLLCFTAFGLDLSKDQVAALQLLAEAALQALVIGTPDA